MLTRLFLNYSSDAKVYEIHIRKNSDCTSIIKCEGISLQEVINRAYNEIEGYCTMERKRISAYETEMKELLNNVGTIQ